MQAGKVAVLVDARLHNELVLRMRDAADVTHIWENVMQDFLDRTRTDDDLWSPQYLREVASKKKDAERRKTGDPEKGYYWEVLFLSNGTLLRMTYKGRLYLAEISHQRLMYDGRDMSPSQFASAVAANTSRNAWRDIEIRLPGEEDFQPAESMRHKARLAQSSSVTSALAGGLSLSR